MTGLWIGLLGGTILGLTGAGGAIVSIPLFTHGIGMSFREATVAALLLVWVSAVLNSWLQRKIGKPKIALILALFSFIGSAGAAQLKPHMPEWSLKAFFAFLCIYSATKIWKKPNTTAEQSLKPLSFWHYMSFGVIVGVVPTFTGLGGGIILVPWLVARTGLKLGQATATSLMTIVFTSSGSLIAQSKFLTGFMSPAMAGAIIGGALLSSVPTMTLIKRLSESRINLVRKALLSFIIFVSLVSLLF